VIVFDSAKHTGGWFIGNFPHAILQTTKFEVAFKKFTKGECSDWHHHTSSVEINVVANGLVRVSGRVIREGEAWIYLPLEASDVEFLEDTNLLVIRVPSINDKQSDVRDSGAALPGNSACGAKLS
jgi:hypothetical protein